MDERDLVTVLLAVFFAEMRRVTHLIAREARDDIIIFRCS